MHFKDGVEKIKSALQHPLPGEAAQHLMAPAMRKTTIELLQERSSHKLSSVLMLLYPDSDGLLQTIFIERPINDSVHSGQLAFPGGKVESWDKNSEEAALRETEEEIGVPASKVEVLGKLSPLFIPASNFLVHPHIGIYHSIPTFYPSPEEVKSLIPVSITDLLLLTPVTKTFKTSYGNLAAPCFEIQSHNLWGATAMMVSEFREMLNVEF